MAPLWKQNRIQSYLDKMTGSLEWAASVLCLLCAGHRRCTYGDESDSPPALLCVSSFLFLLRRITVGLKDVGGQFSKGSHSSWASFWQHCLTQYLPPVFKKLNHKLNNSRGRGKTRKQSQGRRNMFFACEIPSRDPCSGGSQLTWTSALLQSWRIPWEGITLSCSRAAQLWHGAYKDVCGPFLPPSCFMHVWGPWRSLCRHWVLFRVLVLFVCLFK